MHLRQGGKRDLLPSGSPVAPLDPQDALLHVYKVNQQQQRLTAEPGSAGPGSAAAGRRAATAGLGALPLAMRPLPRSAGAGPLAPFSTEFSPAKHTWVKQEFGGFNDRLGVAEAGLCSRLAPDWPSGSGGCLAAPGATGLLSQHHAFTDTNPNRPAAAPEAAFTNLRGLGWRAAGPI